MKIKEIDTLAAQRAALSAPDSQGASLYQQLVMEPLRGFWEPMLSMTRPGMPAIDPAKEA